MKTDFDLEMLVRDNIKSLQPYSTARDEFKGKAELFLDANENTFGSPLPADYNRYPDPMQSEVKEKVAQMKGVAVDSIFLGNGSDEAIDLLYRIFCRPGIDNVVVCPPTYGMYEVAADIHDVEVRKVPLLPDSFELDVENVLRSVNDNTRLLFICSPNNPTGNAGDRASVIRLLEEFRGIVVVDEAYADFSDQSFLPDLEKYPHFVILQTFSKAWGLAGLRLGMAFASAPVIALFNKVKAPYNVNQVSQELLLKAMENAEKVKEWIGVIRSEREQLVNELKEISCVRKVYPSDANFLLVRVNNARGMYQQLLSQGIIVRDRSTVTLCEGCLRITIGTQKENERLLMQLKKYSNEKNTVY